MANNLKELEKLVNLELTSKIYNSSIEHEELFLDVNPDELLNVIIFLKSNDNCKFRQLIDIAGVDFPQEEKRFKLIYLLLSHQYNLRLKLSINFKSEQKISSITKVFPSAN